MGASDDGSRVFFKTAEPLTSDDTDLAVDLYQRTSSGTKRLSKGGPAGGNGAFEADFRGASQDGSRVFFTTFEPLSSDDTDTSHDVYERTSSGTTLLSQGPVGGNGNRDAFFSGASREGSAVFVETAEKLTSADGDTSPDVYKVSLAPGP